MEIPGRRLFAGGVAATFRNGVPWTRGRGGSHKSTERGTNLTFAYLMKFRNGDTLPAGAYRMEVPEDSQTPEVTFSQDGKVMATVKAQVVTQPKKNEDTVSMTCGVKRNSGRCRLRCAEREETDHSTRRALPHDPARKKGEG